MADRHTARVRSYNMSRIRSRSTRPELLIRKFLFAQGLRFRLHVKHLPGKPDIVLPKYRIAILVNGCFWHAHENCRYSRLPQSRQDYWIPKILRNKQKDQENIQALSKLGWRVI